MNELLKTGPLPPTSPLEVAPGIGQMALIPLTEGEAAGPHKLPNGGASPRPVPVPSEPTTETFFQLSAS